MRDLAALLEGAQPVFGIADLPLVNERYVGRTGAGADLNSMRLQAAGVSRLDDAVVAITDFVVADDQDWENPAHLAVLRRDRASRPRCAHARLGRA